MSATSSHTSFHVSEKATEFRITHLTRALDKCPEGSWVVKFEVSSWPHGKQEFTWFGTEEQMRTLYNNMMASFDEKDQPA